jgi:hypothetical protein
MGAELSSTRKRAGSACAISRNPRRTRSWNAPPRARSGRRCRPGRGAGESLLDRAVEEERHRRHDPVPRLGVEARTRARSSPRP